MSPKKQSSSNVGVSVVIATLGERTELLKKTLESITKQGVTNLEIIMVYPLKNKETSELARQYSAISIDDPGSMPKAVNAGIKQSIKKYVTWIGDDDLLLQDSLNSTIRALELNSKGVAAFGYCNYINEDDKFLFTSRAGNFAPWIMTWGPDLVPLPGTLFRTSSLQKLDYIFDESLHYALDLDLFLRLRKIGKLINVGVPVSSFRWHSTSATVSNRNKSLSEAEYVKRKHLPPLARPFAFLWEYPVRIATRIAAQRVTKLAKK